MLAIASDVTYERTTCGSALSASLERGVPDDSALDDAQAGCKARGEHIVSLARAWGLAGISVAVLAVTASRLPPRRHAAEGWEPSGP